MSAPKKRITTQATHSPRDGLNAAFSKLELPGVPTAPPDVSPSTTLPTWKFGRVVLRRETAHRGGKTVIVVHDFAPHLPTSVIETMARMLRQACGCGGTVRNRTIEVQGDQAAKIRRVLEAEGFQVAGVG